MNNLNKRIKEIEKLLQTEDGKDLGGISLESELNGMRFARDDILKIIDELKKNRTIHSRFDSKTITNICNYLEKQIKENP